MERLDTGIIRRLVVEFLSADNDKTRQRKVDCLGMHPVNHARFVAILIGQAQLAILNGEWFRGVDDYFRLTSSL